jgi:oligosaccharide repeat unit polymerase
MATTEPKLINTPNVASTGLMIVGLLGSYFTMLQGSTPSETAGRAAWMVAATLVLSMGLEVRSNWKAVLRPDVICLAALFFLTLFEFLFPQPLFDSLAVESSTIAGITLCLIALGSIAIFRHFAPPMPGTLVTIVTRPTPPNVMLGIFWFSFFFGFLYMLLAVGFNVASLIDEMMGARFSQPWTRGRYGDWKALLNELGMILYLVPPVAGVILAKREKYKSATLIAIFMALLFTFFQGFASGTRYVLAAYVVTFLVGYSLTLMKHRRLEFVILCGVVGIGYVYGSDQMLQFRGIGLKDYLAVSRQPQAPSLPKDPGQSFFVDYNLLMISQLTEQIPLTHQFLGWEVPYLALIRPIPRAIWPGKPEAMSVTFEEIARVRNTTTKAATFVGEAYLAAGTLGVILGAAFFGILTAWWGRLSAALTSEFGVLVYASGFFAIIISMRSMLVLTTAILPTIAAICFGVVFLRKSAESASGNITNIGPSAHF